MSDNEQFGSGGGGGADEELTLPRATVQKLISGEWWEEGSVGQRRGSEGRGIDNAAFPRRLTEALPDDLSASKEVKELIVEACTGE